MNKTLTEKEREYSEANFEGSPIVVTWMTALQTNYTKTLTLHDHR